MPIWRQLPTRPPWQPQPPRRLVPVVAPPAGIITPDPVAVTLTPVAPTIALPTTLTPSPVAVSLTPVAAQVGGRKALLIDEHTEATYVVWEYDTTQPVTIAFWCKLIDTSSGHGNVTTIANPSFNSEVGFWIPDFRERIYQASVMITLEQTDALSPMVDYGDWHHLVFSRDDPSGNFRGYLDGVPFPNETGTTPDPNGIIADAAYLVVGSGGASHFVHGVISQYRVWLARLSAAEVEDEMWSLTAVRTTDLYGDWSFDNTLTDQSGNGRHMAGMTFPNSGAITYADGPPAVTFLTLSSVPVPLTAVAPSISVGGAPTTLTPNPVAVDVEPVALTTVLARELAAAPVVVDLEPVAVALAHAKTLTATPQAVVFALPTQSVSAGAAPTVLTPSPAAADVEPVAIALAHAKALAADPVAVDLEPVGFLLDLGGVTLIAPNPIAVSITVMPITPGGAKTVTLTPVGVPILTVAADLTRAKAIELVPQVVALVAITPALTVTVTLTIQPQAVALVTMPVTLTGVVILGPGLVHAGTEVNGHVRAGSRALSLHGGPTQRP